VEIFNNDEQKPYSLVEITIQNITTIGCFVAPGTILTTYFQIFKTAEPESIQVTSIYNKRTYKALSVTSIHSEIDLLLLEVQADSYSTKHCIELDSISPDLLNNDYNNFYIYHPSSQSYDTIPITIDVKRKQPDRLVFFTRQRIEAGLSGSPIIDRRSGKACAISQLGSSKFIAALQNNEIGSKPSQLRSSKGYAISVNEILKKIPQIKKINQYANSIISNLPDRDYHNFIGRKKEREGIIELLKIQPSQDMTFICGVKGIGKTALAIEIAYNCLSAYQRSLLTSTDPSSPIFDTFIFISLKNNDRFLNRDKLANKDLPDIGLARIVRVIGDTLKIPDLDRIDRDLNFERVYEALARRNALLIVDGLDGFPQSTSQEIVEFLHGVRVQSSTKVIVTTREEENLYSSILLLPLTDEESRDLIRQQGNLDDRAIKEIVAIAVGIPTALTYANCYYRTQNALDYRKPNRSKSNDLGKFCFDRLLESLDDCSRFILTCLSLFVTSSSRDAIRHIAIFKDSKADIEMALSNLERIGLVLQSRSNTEAREETYYRISPIVREYMLERLSSISKLDSTFEREMRSKWVEFYRNFILTPPDRDVLETEWENINEALTWCAIENKYKIIKDIWWSIDTFIKDKKYWGIRFYWWQYLVDESLYRVESTFHLTALIELTETCLKMGNAKQARECFDRAYRRIESADELIRERLEQYKLDLEGMEKSESDSDSNVPIESLWTLS
jgi:archaellum biogenesis ATPase FlaH/DNA-binding PadR family transcriptional regulator